MRSDNRQLPCVQPPTSTYNFQLPLGLHGHHVPLGPHGHHGRQGYDGHGGHVGHGGQERRGEDTTRHDTTPYSISHEKFPLFWSTSLRCSDDCVSQAVFDSLCLLPILDPDTVQTNFFTTLSI